MSSQSYEAFLKQLKSVDQLIEIHGKLQTGKGRRHQQDAIHRAGVVMVVAAWQAYIEKIIPEVLDAIEAGINDQTAVPPAPHWAHLSFKLRRAAIETQIRRFNTPNADNTRKLLQDAIGFDPWPSWTWRHPRRNWDEKATRDRTDDWVRVRHTIAHGTDLPNFQFLQGNNGAPRLTLKLLKECLKHFKHVASKTDDALRGFLVKNYGMAAPW